MRSPQEDFPRPPPGIKTLGVHQRLMVVGLLCALTAAPLAGYIVSRPPPPTLGYALFQPDRNYLRGGDLVRLRLPPGWHAYYNRHRPWRQATITDSKGNLRWEISVALLRRRKASTKPGPAPVRPATEPANLDSYRRTMGHKVVQCKFKTLQPKSPALTKLAVAVVKTLEIRRS